MVDDESADWFALNEERPITFENRIGLLEQRRREEAIGEPDLTVAASLFWDEKVRSSDGFHLLALPSLNHVVLFFLQLFSNVCRTSLAYRLYQLLADLHLLVSLSLGPESQPSSASRSDHRRSEVAHPPSFLSPHPPRGAAPNVPAHAPNATPPSRLGRGSAHPTSAARREWTSGSGQG